jgi:hypothetical protein
MAKIKRLTDAYGHKNFRPEHRTTGRFGDPVAVIIRLIRRSKKRLAEHVVRSTARTTTKRHVRFGISTAPIEGFIFQAIFDASTAANAKP